MKKIQNYFIPVLIGLFIIACGNATEGNESDNDSLKTEQVEVEATETEKKIKLTGKHCFELETEKLSNSIEITILEDNKVKGVKDVYVHDEDYLVTSESIFTGILEGDSLKLDVTIEIEDDVINQSETWALKDSKITIGEEVYTKVECKESPE